MSQIFIYKRGSRKSVSINILNRGRPIISLVDYLYMAFCQLFLSVFYIGNHDKIKS